MTHERFLKKVAIVTGAGQGIGKGVALRLAREGADIVAADIRASNAEQTAREVRQLQRRALAYPINLAHIAEIQPMVEAVAQAFGRIDILVNVAGIIQAKPFLEVTEDDWDRIIDVNQKSVVFCIQAVAKQMIAQVPESESNSGRVNGCYGKIINFSSISGRRGRSLQVHYAASKAAVISITQSAALALAQYGITVNAVAPGVIPTPMWEQNDRDKSRIFGTPAGRAMQDFIEKVPMQRAGTLEEIAGTVAFLCSSDADYLTGQTLNVDGGFEMH
jgi:NAD(P)-dependent dehydrogenase (short-subunit alcohol dehydrogenase family)